MTNRRIDAWETPLTEQQRWAAYERIKRFPWHEAAQWIADEFKVSAPSRSAIYRFKAEMASQESAHRIESALSVKEDVRKQMAAVGDMSDELQYAYEQLAAESALRGDEKAGIRYLAMATRYSEGKLEREKLRLKQEAEKRAQEALALEREKFEAAERRAAQADRAEEVTSADLSPEEKEKRLKEIFGLA